MSASILLIHDDPALVRWMSTVLGDLGRVRSADGGAAGLALAARERPDLILLAEGGSGVRGVALRHALDACGEHEDIPVIVVGARRDEAFEVRCLDAGAADVIRKPVSGPVLRARVRMHLRRKNAFDALTGIALTDALTGLANRRAFDGMLARAWKHAGREGTALGMLMIDVDRFKQFNDLYGHPAGDACLAAVAGALRDVPRRPYDMVARYGGEEFAVLLAGATPDGMREVARRLLAAVLALRIPHLGGVAGAIVSISLGGAIARPRTPGPVGSTASLAWRADQALYRAKREGRSRFRLAAEAAPDAPARPVPRGRVCAAGER